MSPSPCNSPRQASRRCPTSTPCAGGAGEGPPGWAMTTSVPKVTVAWCQGSWRWRWTLLTPLQALFCTSGSQGLQIWGRDLCPLNNRGASHPCSLKYRVIIVPWANKSRCVRCCKVHYVCQETRGRAGTPRTCSSIGPGFAASLLINTFAQGSFIMFYI